MVGNWPIHHPLVLHRCDVIARMVSFVARYEASTGWRLGRERKEIKDLFVFFTADHPDSDKQDSVKYSEAHHHHSRAALRAIRKTGKARRSWVGGLRHEHPIPRNFVLESLLADPDVRALRANAGQVVARILSKHMCVAIITVKEDRRLSSAGLMREMPGDWNGEDHFARYAAIGLELLPPTGIGE